MTRRNFSRIHGIVPDRAAYGLFQHDLYDLAKTYYARGYRAGMRRTGAERALAAGGAV